MTDPASERRRPADGSELLVASFALVASLAGQVMLSLAIHGTNYGGSDGKMAQASILTALSFSRPFHFNNLSPIQGLGSQLLPLNVWANPAYWSFAVLGRESAPDVSAAVALAIFATATYIMARCFDVPVVASAIAAQLCIGLFAPALFILKLSTVFSIMTGNAVVYAPQMVALGLLARLEPGSWRAFGLTTAGIFGLLIYSLCCDPLWATVVAVGWAVPFAVVALGSARRRTVLLRCAALGGCVALLAVSRAIEYVYVLTRYTARVEFARVVDRPRGPDLPASALFYSPVMKYFYLVCAIAWLLGIVTLRGRPRMLVVAAGVTGVGLLAYILTYLVLLDVPWRAPLPVYLEQGLTPLFVVAAVAGILGALRVAAAGAWRLAARVVGRPGAPPGRWPPRGGAVTAAVVAVAIVPAAVAAFAVRDGPAEAERYWERWPHEPEIVEFFAERVGAAVGRPFRGAVHFWSFDYGTTLTVYSLWARAVPTVLDYSQLVAPPSLYFVHAVLERDVRGMLNGFVPAPIATAALEWKMLELFGARYYVAGHAPSSRAESAGLPRLTFPFRPLAGDPGLWYVYELPRPNVGDFSPTEVIAAGSAADIAAVLRQPGFDFRRQAVLSTPLSGPLAPARDMRLSWLRGRLHVAGSSDGTSLVVLPQLFSRCLRASDGRVRLVRADLMMTGVVFSGRLDTDIVYDLGIFAPGCRRADLADVRRLDARIDLRQPHLLGDRVFPDWDGLVTRLRAAAAAVQ
jgi:hypothetical protein